MDDETLLKSIRLVCPVWADIACVSLGRRCGVTFKAVESCCSCRDKESCKDLKYFNPQLARKITIVIGCDCSPASDENFEGDTFLEKLVHILPKINESVEELRLILHAKVGPHWREMWMAFAQNFPKLSETSISLTTLTLLPSEDTEAVDEVMSKFKQIKVDLVLVVGRLGGSCQYLLPSQSNIVLI